MEFVHVMDIRATISEPLEIGETSQGRRRIIPITGGTFDGPRLKGIIVPGGADWQIIDAYSHTHLEARYCLQTDDGVMIAVTNRECVVVPKRSCRG